MENFFTQQRALVAFGAVVFDESSFDGERVRHNASLTYKIRLRAEQYKGSYGDGPVSGGTRIVPSTLWQTSHMFPRRPSVGPRGDMYGGTKPGQNII